MLVVRGCEVLQQHGQLVFVGNTAHLHAVLVADFKRRGVIVNGDFLVAVRVFLGDKPPEILRDGNRLGRRGRGAENQRERGSEAAQNRLHRGGITKSLVPSHPFVAD